VYLNQHQSTSLAIFSPQAWMDEIHHFYGVNPTFIQDSNHKTNQLEATDSMVRSPHILKPKIAEIEKIKIFFFLNQFFFMFIQIINNPMVRSSTRLPFVLGFLGEVDQLKFS
jgi:hypothetical protein